MSLKNIGFFVLYLFYILKKLYGNIVHFFALKKQFFKKNYSFNSFFSF